jgi:hypothetical protein
MARNLFANQPQNWGLGSPEDLIAAAAAWDQGDIADDEGELSLSDKARLLFRGSTSNLSDEIKARLSSTFGEGTYEEDLATERAKIESARDKPGSLPYEVVGAFLPAIALAPFTGGASLGWGAGRMAAVGAAQALAAGLGDREGNLKERFTDSPLSLGVETVAGALAAPLGSVVMKLAQRGAGRVTQPLGDMGRALTGQHPRPVETEVRRLASSVYPNYAPEVAHRKIVERIRGGDTFADLAPTEVAAQVGASGPGGTVIREVVNKRAERLPREAREAILEDLAPGDSQSNLVRVMNETTDELKAAARVAYDDVFDAVDLPPSAELNSAVLDLAKFDDAALTRLNKLIKKRKLPPLFKENDKGVLELTRNVSLEEGEVVRRSLKDATDVNYRAGEGGLAELDSIAERDMRSILDDLSPELKTTRAKWKQLKSVKDTYDDSRKIFGKTAEDAEIYIEDMIIEGNLEKIAAMRAGAASGLKAKSTGASATTLLRNLDNLDRKERIILEKLYPGDAAEEIFNKINKAVQATETKNVVLKGAQTAHRLGAQGQQGQAAVEAVGDAVALGAGDYLRPAVKFVQGVLKGRQLTQKELEKVARIIITEDPDIMERALLNPGIQQELVNKIQRYAGLLPRAASSAAAYQTEEKTRRLLDDPNR